MIIKNQTQQKNAIKLNHTKTNQNKADYRYATHACIEGVNEESIFF